MAKKEVKLVTVTCDVHGESCKAPQEELKEFKLPFSPEDGKPLIADLCPPEYKKREAAKNALLAGLLLDEEEDGAREDARAEEHDAIYAKAYDQGKREGIEEAKPKGKGGTSQAGKEEDDPYAPLFKAIRHWYSLNNPTGLRGRLTLTRDVAKDFLKTPVGKAWKEWEPGKVEPILSNGMWVTPEQEEIPAADGDAQARDYAESLVRTPAFSN